MEQVTAKISGIVYSNKSTGFHVLKVDSDGDLITIKGSFPGVPLSVGLKIIAKGDYETHPTYGRQLNATQCQVIHEKGRAGIVQYLISHVNSIGPVTAARLYDAFGDDLINVLEKEPDKIRSLSFLTANQSEAIINEWSTSNQVRNATIFLSDLGLSASQIKSVFTKHGSSNKIKEIIENNPYVICDCAGIGFVTADQVAQKLGIPCDSIIRSKAFVYSAIREMSFMDGHMFVTIAQIKDFISKIFKRNPIRPFSHGEYVSDSHIYESIKLLKEEDLIVDHDGNFYTTFNYNFETKSADKLSRMLMGSGLDIGVLEKILAEFQEKSKVDLSDDQKKAFLLLAQSKVCVITGFPGTGKTTMISAFVYLFEKLGLTFNLMSPTGIAAKRLSQVTGKAASTIHRSLGYQPDGTWTFTDANKFISDAIIVDEMSMVDSAIFYRLISSLKNDTFLIMVGDHAQLPSVGAGNVLKSLISSSEVPHVSLSKIYRQGKTSDIVTVSHSILNGTKINTSFNKDSECVFINIHKDDVIDEVRKLASKLKEKEKTFQVIAPVYDGDLGVNVLNDELREVLNTEYDPTQKNKSIRINSSDLHIGDRVMIIKNDYERMIFNGEVGKVTSISLRDDKVQVKIFNWFDYESPTPSYVDKIMTFKVEEARTSLKVAYACTAHKYQGQEIDYVIMPMTHKYGIMLYKNLLYTALTRAKKKVFIIGEISAFEHGITVDRDLSRNSNLTSMIHQSYKITTADHVHEILW